MSSRDTQDAAAPTALASATTTPETPETPRAPGAAAVPPVEAPPRPDGPQPRPAAGRAPAAGRGAAHDTGPIPLRGRFSWLGGRGSLPQALEPLVATVRSNHPRADTAVIERAYAVAERAHRGQKRKSGDAYITHPVAVATILAELGMTPPTLVAALLHDTVEDTEYSLAALRAEFGEEIAMLVDGVTKLDKVTYGEAAQAETVRKMVVAMARDIRVLVIKLADRLHNARTWRYVSAESAARKARETLEIYAPLAHRLGMNTLKWELEDLSFAALYPGIYDEVVRLVAEQAPAREEYLDAVADQISADLRAAKIKSSVTGRPKHYYSVYQKMVVGKKDFEEIYDLVALRVLVDSVRDCYAVLGALHARWNPMPGRFKDYIAMPKFNMYQSLHTTVIGPGGKAVEIQIRTHAMHRRAEYGVAAHWKYKDALSAKPPASGRPASAGGDDAGGQDMAWLRQLVNWQQETADPGEFLESLRFEINAAEVFVFTPKGEVMGLPAGSTPVDLAYAIHTEVGHRAMGARVNGRLVPLETALDNGDVVEIFTSRVETAGPSHDWLGFVKSPRARNKIRAWFSKERREEAIESGQASIAKAMRKQHLPLQRLMSHASLAGVASEMRYADVSALYAAVGENHVSAQAVVERLVAALGGEVGAGEDLAESVPPPQVSRRPRTGDASVTVKGADDVWTSLARCCTPVPGDDIAGFVTQGRGVSVHRTDCGNMPGLRAQPERMVEVEWAVGADGSTGVYLVQVQVEALDRSGLLSDVTRAISDSHVNILSASVSTGRDRVAVSRFTFEMADPGHLDAVLSAARHVPGVFDAYRMTGGKNDKRA